MNILIVDDNANNRLILRLMLDDYEESHDVNFKIEEAQDGKEAIDMCIENYFDIVFMDIMMPNVDGLEATKAIKECSTSTMVIAVSAVDDNERIKLILNYGAEDYIPKPVNSDLFMNRIYNYFNIIKSRSHKVENKNYRNTYSSNVYNRYTKFIVDSDDSLAEFWEFFLFEASEKFDNVSNVVRTVFSISEAQLQLAGLAEVYIEESDTFQYFTLVNIDVLPFKAIELMIKKSQSYLEYKVLDNKLSFQLEKINTMIEEQEAPKVKVISITEDNSEKVQSQGYKKADEVLTVYDYLDEDDKIDLEEYSAKLNSLMLIVGSGDISADEVHEMYSYLDKLGQILSTYSEIYPISVSLSSLSVVLKSHIDTFIDKSSLIGPLCKAFSNDMTTWIQMSFYTGAPSIDFMNDTIAVNTQTISSMLTMDDAISDSEDNLDDIFDF